MGEPLGRAKEVGRNYLTIATAKALHNGDGLCFIDPRGQLQGFRVNRVEGTRLYPKEMPHGLSAGTPLFRNYDQEFERLLARPSAERRIPVDIHLRDIPFGYALTITDEQGQGSTVTFARDKELARTEQRAGIEAQLSKLGGTILVAKSITLTLADNWFIPSSVVADMRRAAVEAYERAQRCHVRPMNPSAKPRGTQPATLDGQLTYLGNVANRRAAEFYRQRGVSDLSPAYELSAPRGATLMYCRHCLRYAMGWCPHRGGKPSPYREPYTLVSADGKRFALSFDCKQCIMQVKER
jgi:putative protease